MDEQSKPVPRLKRTGATRTLRELKEVGSSVWLPIPMNTVGQAAAYAGLTGKYTARSEEGGVRVWRIKD
jgi:hypothetical protein